MPSFFDSIRARVRAQAIGRTAAAASPTKTSSGDNVPLAVDDPSQTLANSFTSPVASMPTTTSPYVGMQAEPNQSWFGELKSNLDFTTGEPGYAAAKKDATPYGIFDTTKTVSESIKNADVANLAGKAAQTAIGAVVPFGGLLNSLTSGSLVQTPLGNKSFRPSGGLGAMYDLNMNNQYGIAAEVAKGTPGFHQFSVDGKVVGISPGPMGMGTVVSGTFKGSPQDAMNMYAAMMRVDPKTADFSQSPTSEAFGEPLSAFMAYSGGFDKQGNFVDALGVTDTTMSADRLAAHVGLVNDFVGANAALNAVEAANVSQSVKDTMMAAINAGELRAQTVTDAQGNVVGYNTAMGGAVQGMFTQDGAPVTYGNGYLSAQDAAQAYGGGGTPGVDAQMAGDWSGNVDSGDGGYMGGGYDTGFAGISADDFSFGVDTSNDVSDDESYSPAEDNNSGGNDDSGDFGGYDGGYDDGDWGGFARGGYAMAEGGKPPVLQEGQPPAGFASKQTTPPPVIVGDGSPATEAETVADDVPADVEEGTFVLNAPAVEFAGLEDIKKMLLGAMEEAERQGIDITQNNTKMSKENLVSLVVSKKEVLIPPVLAEIIGYDRLEKINNRGKQEVEKRIAENGQSPEAEQAQAAAADGGEQGFAKKPDQTDEFADIYSSIQKQGGDPRLGFKDFTKTMKMFAKGRIYRPMQAEPNTPEFDAEVREKYNLFFLDEQKYPFMDEAAREAAAQTDKANMIDNSLPLARQREDGTIYYIDRDTGKEVPNPNSGEGFVPAP